MAGIGDYGIPTDTLASPSLSEWAAAVATQIAGAAGSRGGQMATLETVATGGLNNWLDGYGPGTVWGGVTAGVDYLQVPVAGWWLCGFFGGFNAAAGGTYRSMRLAILGGDSTTIPANSNHIGASINNVTPGANWTYSGLAASGLWYLSAGGGIRVMARHDAGVAVSASANMFILYQHA